MTEWPESGGGHGDSPYLYILNESWVGVEEFFGGDVFKQGM